ncbi:putative Transmembrane and tpr repeat-containing protein [Daphnia magna]|uniref:Putative Transmembrane and tpr repeat-containing protein n=1 Tax=Daphnia magna TaxID=35525 RepID=A0A164VVS2_9CRUS|nr:putative Transmembrane and tpr repeat-containing protein [Daphnia magna]
MDLAVIICPLVAFLLYYDTLQAGFVYDDKKRGCYRCFRVVHHERSDGA